MTKTERIEQEQARLVKIYADLPEDTMNTLQPLIERAAFMRCTLEDLEQEINLHGPVEEYTNGQHQRGRKQSAAVQAYDSMMKNYNNAIKILSAKMPVVTVKEVPVVPKWYKPEPDPEEFRRSAEEARQQAHEILEKIRAGEL